MTSQSRKKHPITVQMFIRAKRVERQLDLNAWLKWVRPLLLGGSTLLAPLGLAQEGMRPVPRFSGTSVRDARSQTQKASSSVPLQWRVSREVATQESPTAEPVSNVGALNASALPQGQSAAPSAGVQQVRYQAGFTMPDEPTGEPAIPLPKSLDAPAAPTTPPPTDFFTDPFGDEAANAQAAPTMPAPTMPAPAAQPPAPTLPSQENSLRSPAPLGAPAVPEASPETAERLPDNDAAAEDAEQSPRENPFDRTRPEEAAPSRAPRQIEDFDLPRQPDASARSRKADDKDRDDLRRTADFSCDQFRRSIAEDKIQKISLDISPPFRPDVIELTEYEKLKTKFDNAQEVRDWQSVDGRKLGRGKLRDLAYEKVIIETEYGTTEELPINRVSEADLAYLSRNWGLPQECLIQQVAYEPRAWQHAKVTWKAPNLCHKPLYFEEVNLERYGHDAGPFAQPLISSAHFFVNIAVLPYKMGVHAPHECQYTLGYYRPGNCAPWIVPPVPISVRGGLYQAAAMTGAFWLIP